MSNHQDYLIYIKEKEKDKFTIMFDALTILFK